MKTTWGFAEPPTGDPTHLSQRWVANAAWLIRLRWVAVIGQLATIAVVSIGFGVSLALGPLLVIIAATALVNLALDRIVRRGPVEPNSSWSCCTGDQLLAAVMGLDILALTALLYFAGGAANPFSVFYLVNLALCALILPERWGWALAAVAVVGLALLVVFNVKMPELHQPFLAWPFTLSDFGKVVALATCALVIVLFVTRVTQQLERTQAELRRIERERSRNEKLQALGTLAGGAAHELATPLSTIAVVSNEMLRHLRDTKVPDQVHDDLTLIRDEVDHCQTILARMTGRAGQTIDEEVASISLRELVDETINELSAKHRVRIVMPDSAGDARIHVPRESLAVALRGLLQNGLDATGADEPIEMSLAIEEQSVRVTIRDQGPGMSQDVLKRAGEPFFTTKEPGRGMGLGLFLARSVVERIGGMMRIESKPGQGVTAVLHIPR